METEELYKQETGFNAYYIHQHEKIYYKSYVKWLEKRFNDTKKELTLFIEWFDYQVNGKDIDFTGVPFSHIVDEFIFENIKGGDIKK